MGIVTSVIAFIILGAIALHVIGVIKNVIGVVIIIIMGALVWYGLNEHYSISGQDAIKYSREKTDYIINQASEDLDRAVEQSKNGEFGEGLVEGLEEEMNRVAAGQSITEGRTGPQKNYLKNIIPNAKKYLLEPLKKLLP